MGLGDYRYSISIVSDRNLDGASNDGVVSTGALVRVFDAGTRTHSTIYSNAARGAKTNPISRSQYATDGGRIEFYSSASSHSISVALSDGSLGKFTVTPQTRSVTVVVSGVQKCLVSQVAAFDVETDTGDDLPLGAWVRDCLLEVTTADATETLDIGLLSSESGGDADGFHNDISIASTGFVARRAYTVGSNETYVSSVTYGVLLGTFLAGSDAATDEGIVDISGHIVTSAKSVSYTGSSGTDTVVGFIYLPFIQLM